MWRLLESGGVSCPTAGGEAEGGGGCSTRVFDLDDRGKRAKEAAGRLPYWLSNTSALLCLLQKNLQSNGFFGTPSRCCAGGLGGKLAQLAGRGDTAQVDARYPAILFKQQLTTCVEKIFGHLRDNLKKGISPLLSLCIQAPKSTRPGKAPKAPGVGAQQPSNSHWDNIVSFLNLLMDTLRENHVPSFFIRKLITQLFSFVNIQLFNRSFLLLEFEYLVSVS
ncbi:protein OPAQUE1-like [Hordeum vulgare subsp. vulgare]|uniref:protein OPAQUE1-like n=1 Tax=Hordeum vulgare subsp. vulgare TaxID=112509 RepID=UPI001D1A4C2B|nr:protein OPAQUE1-like [Hordeum vulgare subsp. vulgare]